MPYNYQYYNPYADPAYLALAQKRANAGYQRQTQQGGGGGAGLANTAGELGGQYAGREAIKNGYGLDAISSYFAPGSAAVTTQGAVGYDATAATLPELFGGTAPASTAISSSAPMSYSIGTSAAAPTTTSAALTTSAETQAPAAVGFASYAVPIAIAALMAQRFTASKKTGEDKQRDAIKNKFNELGITEDFKAPTGVDIGHNLSDQGGFEGVRDYDLFNKDGTPIHQLAPYLIDQVEPVSRFISGGQDKIGSDATGYLVKSVLAKNPKNQAEADAILKETFSKMKLDKKQIAEGLQAMGGGVGDKEALMPYFDKLDKKAVPRGGKQGALYRLPTGLYGEIINKGVADQEIADRLGAKYNRFGVTPDRMSRVTVGGLFDPEMGKKLNALTKEEQERSLNKLKKAGYIRGNY